ncbi:MAG: hypothetical protein HC927_11795, partial [Deltaproteobacteria bacterium]|nr:hypothetical protein [Deltaproteobacteria bacterium]
MTEVERALDGQVLPEFWDDLADGAARRPIAGCFAKLGFADRSTTTISHV